MKIEKLWWLAQTHLFCSFHFTIINFHFLSHDQVHIKSKKIFISPGLDPATFRPLTPEASAYGSR